jgi:hypothetical protein
MRRTLLILLLAVGSVRGADPDVTITLRGRQATAMPHRVGFTHTGGGNITVSQPSPDSVVVTMAGVAVAGAHPCKDSVAVLTFDLLQELEVNIHKKDVKQVQLLLEGRIVGLLRSHKHGSASISCPAQATLSPCGDDGAALLHVRLPGRSVTCGENLSVKDQLGPAKVLVPAAAAVRRAGGASEGTGAVQSGVGGVRAGSGTGPALDQRVRAVQGSGKEGVRLPGDDQGRCSMTLCSRNRKPGPGGGRPAR